MKKYSLLLMAILLVSHVVFAQNYSDALRYSQTEYNGTAQSIALGNAYGALGGDFISASINPAGLGIYRTGEVALSPAFGYDQVKSNYLGTTESDDKYQFNLNNLGFVGTIKSKSDSGFISLAIGVGFNRLKDFNSNSYILGNNATTTLLNYYTDRANEAGNSDDFDKHNEDLAWDTYLINVESGTDSTGYTYNNWLTNNNSVIANQQKKMITTSGHLDEYLFSMAANIDHRVYVGFSTGIVNLNYDLYSSYTETPDEEASEYLNNYKLKTYLTENGTGVNFKLGIIYRPVKQLRIGAAIHTPTFYNITRYQYNYLSAHYNTEVGYEDSTTEEMSKKWSDDSNENFSYKLQTPMKANFSVAYTFGEKALLSVDYELINYSSVKFRDSGDSYDYTDENSINSKVFKSAGNLRIGGEYKLAPGFSIRAGYNLIGNSWNSSYTNDDGETIQLINSSDTYSIYSAGFGYAMKHFFMDFAYRYSQNDYSHRVHEISDTNPSGGNAVADLSEIKQQMTFTFGYRF